jgi:hypothetical protein
MAAFDHLSRFEGIMQPPSVSTRTLDILRHLAGKPGHDEVKADIRELLVNEFGAERHAIDFERRVPEVRGRLDALVGRTIFEAKSDLAKEWGDVARRMPDYLADREREEGERYTGIATDGLRWAVLQLDDGSLVELKETTLIPDKAGEFLAWLDGALALKASLPPDPLTVRIELGQDSVAFARAKASLAQLWEKLKGDPAIALKRQLWAQMLKLVYGRDADSDALWFQHSFLVIVAKAIAFAVLDIAADEPADILSGAALEARGISGAVESDFFDWMVADAEGVGLLRRIVALVRRFRLKEVESDVLKTLYESLIDRDERKGLGEYYTPDWLAAKIVRHAVTAPLEQRVLDPACGSGTFLFHAVRHFLAEAEEGGMPPQEQAREAVEFVAGMDIHPVAVIIARVTFILALAPALGARQGRLRIPVYLGDSMQLSVGHMIGGKELTIRVPPPSGGENGKLGNGVQALKFPEIFCREPELFDESIDILRQGSIDGAKRDQVETALHRAMEDHFWRQKQRRIGHARLDPVRPIEKAEMDAIRDMGATFLDYDRLRRAGRDSIWSYVARNLSRPLFYSLNEAGWAQVVLGNPPWVAYRHMSPDLQKRFKELAQGARVYVGGKFATQNDLSALFTVRAAQLYLRAGARIAFVLPLAALTRGQFEKLRSGSFDPGCIAWDEAWTMDDSVQPLFPVPSCVLFGRRRRVGKPVPETVRAYSGSLPRRDAPEAIADKRLTVTQGAPRPTTAVFVGGSAYRGAFRQGATLVPRMLCFVNRKAVGRIGIDRTRPPIESRRSSQEKRPWKELPGLDGNVEAGFLRPVLLGESILPYRVFRPFEAVVPVLDDGTVLDAEAARNRGYRELPRWMGRAETLWRQHAESGDMTLIERWDYHKELSAQFPLAPNRIVYAASGSQPAACLIATPSVFEHMLYWARPETEHEANYLVAILNSETARSRVASLQSRGQWGARHFDKVIFNLPIPRFDKRVKTHRDLAAAAQAAEALAASVPLPDSVQFQRARRLVREALIEAGLARRIDTLVAKLLDSACSRLTKVVPKLARPSGRMP